MDMSGSPTDPDLAQRLPNAEDFAFADLTHFIPMEAPALVAKHVEEMLAKMPAGTT